MNNVLGIILGRFRIRCAIKNTDIWLKISWRMKVISAVLKRFFLFLNFFPKNWRGYYALHTSKLTLWFNFSVKFGIFRKSNWWPKIQRLNCLKSRVCSKCHKIEITVPQENKNIQNMHIFDERRHTRFVFE